jgi:LmbE family N-acetylglucosaminyl deacetylase
MDRPQLFERLNDKFAARALVTAHPDDECLWFGGLLLRYPGEWTIICCSVPTRDPIRAYKFFNACDALGARGRLLPFHETLERPLKHLESIEIESYDVIVTHGPKGEYGHPHHRQVHSFVRKRVSGPILCSAYNDQGDYAIELSASEWTSKLAALKLYDHEMHWLGHMRPTWEALIDEYGTSGKHHGFDLKCERYAAH